MTKHGALSLLNFPTIIGMILIWVGRKHCNDWERTWVYFTLNCYRTTFNPVETNTVKFYGKIINILVLRHFKFSKEKKSKHGLQTLQSSNICSKILNCITRKLSYNIIHILFLVIIRNFAKLKTDVFMQWLFSTAMSYEKFSAIFSNFR